MERTIFSELSEYRFSSSGFEVVMSALDQARKHNHNYLGTEHFLLGVVKDDDIQRYLANINSGRTDRIIRTINQIMGRNDEPVSDSQVLLTPGAKKILDLAKERTQGVEIGPIHILYGVAKEGEGIGASVLEESGLIRRILQDI